MLRLTYLLLLFACLVGTLPLELVLKARVYARWRRLLIAVLPPAVLFIAWDYLATAAGWWRFDRRYVVGAFVNRLPLEELLFFLVIPICAVLTLEAVRRLRPDWAISRNRSRRDGTDPPPRR